MAARYLAAAGLLVAALLVPCASRGAPARPVVQVPWRPGNADAFQIGAAEERRIRAAHGFLPVKIYRPDGAAPSRNHRPT